MLRTIPRFVRAAVEEVPDAPWLVGDGAELTYAEAHARIRRAASGLRAAGVAAGDVVVTLPSTRIEHLLGWLALMEVGAVEVPVDPRSTAVELAGLLGQVRPALLVGDADVLERAEAAVAAVGARHRGAPVRAVDVAELHAADDDGRGPADAAPEDVAVMLPTSGTTGRSKLVLQTHLAYVMAGEGFPWWMDLTAEDRLLTTLPLFHVNARAYSALGSVGARAALALVPSFSARRFLDDVRRVGATEFNAIGAMVEILLRRPELPDDADTPLRRAYTALSPTRERHEEFERRFGLELVCGYGLSECTYGLIWARGTRPFGTMGSPRQHPTLGHVNDARLHEPDAAGVGELELRNPAVTPGYLDMPEETAEVLVDGWLRTGDLVTAGPDGTFTFVGRRKEVIRRRGENLSPTEVEAALAAHPDVAEVAVVGVPSELSEQEVKAFLVAEGDRTLDVGALDRFARERLARFKVPRYYEVVAELPHTPTGRLAKHRLPQERTPGEVDVEDRPRP